MVILVFNVILSLKLIKYKRIVSFVEGLRNVGFLGMSAIDIFLKIVLYICCVVVIFRLESVYLMILKLGNM